MDDPAKNREFDDTRDLRTALHPDAFTFIAITTGRGGGETGGFATTASAIHTMKVELARIYGLASGIFC